MRELLQCISVYVLAVSLVHRHRPEATRVPDDIDILQRDECEKEVRPRNDFSSRGGLVEPDRLEKCRGVIHQRIESA